MTSVEALDLHGVERRIEAVRAVRQVLQSVWGLARAELPIVEDAARETSHYVRWCDEAFGRVLDEAPDVPGARALRVLIGPERAFAGALPRRYEEALEVPGPLGIVGLRLAQVVEERPSLRGRVLFSLPGTTSPAETEPCAASVATAILAHGTDERVLLVHPGDDERLVESPVLGARRSLRDDLPEMYSPLEVVVDGVLRELVTARLAHALAVTLRAEVRARLAMAESARTSCDRRLEELQRAWRAARQDQITSEIVELVAARLAFED